MLMVNALSYLLYAKEPFSTHDDQVCLALGISALKWQCTELRQLHRHRRCREYTLCWWVCDSLILLSQHIIFSMCFYIVLIVCLTILNKY